MTADASDGGGREELEAPPTAEALYLYRADEVLPERPHLTGDVFDGIEIPGLDDEPGLAVVLSHPCSMRSNGVDLIERLQLARVSPYSDVHLNSWKRHHHRVMPLPDLCGGGDHYAAQFANFGLVASSSLHLDRRVACMDPLGINLLQQRFIFNVARCIVPTAILHRSCVGAFDEVALMEEWNCVWAEKGLPAEQAGLAFHNWICDDGGTGQSRQDRLAHDQQRAPIRREMRSHLRDLT